MALAAAVATLNDPALTPSARVLAAMARDYGDSYSRFVQEQSLRHRDAILALPMGSDVAARFAELAEASRVRQREMEASDTLPFEAFRQQYIDPRRLHI
jgi:glutamate--cysteine ligase